MQNFAFYGAVWVLYIAISLIFLYSLYRLISVIGWTWLQDMVVVTVAIILLVPTAIPGYEGYYAPVAWVILFEVFFQKAGYPAGALFLMQVSCVVGWLLVLVKHWRS